LALIFYRAPTPANPSSHTNRRKDRKSQALLRSVLVQARIQRDMKRLECLDGLRGILAVYVLLGHVAPFAVLADWVQDAVSHGSAAVDVFFVLSGLVITQSLLRAEGRAKPFLILRAARIFPVFLAVFALAVLVGPWSCGFERMPWIGSGNAARSICVMSWPDSWLAEIAAHLTMTHGLFPKLILPDIWVSFLGSAWSLSTEWQFYVLAVLVGGRSRRLCWLLLALAVAGAAWRLTATETWQFSRAFLPNKAHFFALGVASLPVVRRAPAALRQYGIVLAATLVICATEGSIGKILPPLAWTTCLGIQMLPVRGVAMAAGWLLRNAVARYLGAISYCLYLVNEPIHKLGIGLVSRVANGDAMLFTLLWIPVAIGVPILASVWLHNHLEVPALRWGHRLSARSVRGTV
jgi:peptidoglycan/LPS O-acetylase OafA/YrhL